MEICKVEGISHWYDEWDSERLTSWRYFGGIIKRLRDAREEGSKGEFMNDMTQVHHCPALSIHQILELESEERTSVIRMFPTQIPVTQGSLIEFSKSATSDFARRRPTNDVQITSDLLDSHRPINSTRRPISDEMRRPGKFSIPPSSSPRVSDHLRRRYVGDVV